MSRRNLLIATLVYTLVTTAAVSALGLQLGWSFESAALILVILWIVYGIVLFFEAGTIVVDEMSVAVIFARHTHNFVYFIDSNPSKPIDGERPFNCHKKRIINQLFYNRLPYQHFINPFQEYVQDTISKRPQTAQGATEFVRTKEGIPLTINWSMGYTLDPVKIRPKIEYKLARALPQFSKNMLSGRVVHSLRYIIEQKNATDLYCQDAIKNLEKELRAEVTSRIQGIGFNDIADVDTKIGPVVMPPQVEKALQAAHERAVQTQTTTKALEDIHKVISLFDDDDMERLAELERLRILDEHGDSLMYSVSLLMKTMNGN
ncbi:MAG: hypothetical protein IPF56_19070 [Chloroflexi bacterium]|nr:hypothetical protein [Chloroflexota bacterium]MBK7177444.1 hypothetical protein [Chloroflexota bacterium]